MCGMRNRPARRVVEPSPFAFSNQAGQGDTTSAMAGAMAACYSKVSLGHIEAGLRSHNKFEPFPEEVNRKLIDVMADLHFAPTLLDKRDLMAEGFQPDSIYVTATPASMRCGTSRRCHSPWKGQHWRTCRYSASVSFS
jgi:hypothetical protein